MELTVLSVDALTPRIARLRLGRDDGKPLPCVEPGAHVEIALGPDGANLVHRAYSIVNAGLGSTYYELAVLREDSGRGGSRRMHQLRQGDRLQVAAPRNDFRLARDGSLHRLIAGGIGITPLLAMARALAQRGTRFQLDYLCRNATDAAYVREVRALPNATLWFDGGVPESGPSLARLLGEYDAGHHVYVCGPRGLVQSVVDLARSAGWPPEAVHYELFAGTLAHSQDRAFDVVVKGAGLSVRVGAEQTLLEALEAAGVNIPSDCRRGDCGVCITTVLQGRVDHRDSSLTAAEREAGKLMCPCVSRSLDENLVISL